MTDGRTLAVGVDLTWWGGSPRLHSSRVETIAAAILGEPESLHFADVDLSAAPNPEASEFYEANFDAGGELFVGGIARTLEHFEGRFDRVILALDAPLLARPRPDQPRRRKANYPGERSGLELRAAEVALHDARKRIGGAGRGWNRDLKVQAGSPLPPRVAEVVAKLGELGFTLFRGAETGGDRQLIEVFPSEAIWALGIAGRYGNNATSKAVRRYKAKSWKELSPDSGTELARRPLLGFSALLRDRLAGDARSEAVPTWIDRIAAHATFCALHPRKQTVGQRKRFDDVVDSGIALLTAVTFAAGCFHSWGEGEDGTIVGPGVWEG